MSYAYDNVNLIVKLTAQGQLQITKIDTRDDSYGWVKRGSRAMMIEKKIVLDNINLQLPKMIDDESNQNRKCFLENLSLAITESLKKDTFPVKAY